MNHKAAILTPKWKPANYKPCPVTGDSWAGVELTPVWSGPFSMAEAPVIADQGLYGVSYSIPVYITRGGNYVRV